MKRPKFVNDQIYHVYNRGVEKRNVFLDDRDYFRFIHNLFEFNDERPAENLYSEVQPRKLLVKILVFCLMPNHYHLLLRQEKENGIVKFMQKLGTGYTMYFNQKHDRVGALFQGRFKAILIDKEPHFFYLPCYIHINPLDLIESKWREGEIKDYQGAIDFLENYRWSSHSDYVGKKNFPSVTQREFLLDYFRGENQYKKSIENWLKEMDLGVTKEAILE
jgi:putative transposase